MMKTRGTNSNSQDSLKISKRFLSYFEKHRIFALFQELSTMLLIKKPEDHVLFLKQSLYHAARRLDAPRIIILSLPEFDKSQLSNILRNKLNVPVVTLNDILCDEEFIPEVKSSIIIKKLRIILNNYMKNNCDGWILLDFPRTNEDARCLQRSGIIPTHVIDIISSVTKSTTSLENIANFNYNKEIHGLRQIFSKFIMTIHAKNKQIENIAEECLNSIKFRNYFHGTTSLRILLIDATDSLRCKCLAQHIAQVFHLFHIDFHEVLEKICLCDSELGDKLQEAKETANLNNFPVNIKIEAFEHFLNRSTNVKKGWVLTGFVTTTLEFKNLDMTDSPPNRVLIIVPENYENIENENSNENADDKHMPVCDKTIAKIIKYAGKSANIIKYHSDLKVMKEKIEIILMQPPPCVPPRIPRQPSIIKFKDIEYDPDDEPSIELLHEIRETEPELPLI